MELTEPLALDYSDLDSFVIYICTQGEATVNSVNIKAGETLLLPATTTLVEIDSCGATLLQTYIG